jgi:hypothetical protein
VPILAVVSAFLAGCVAAWAVYRFRARRPLVRVLAGGAALLGTLSVLAAAFAGLVIAALFEPWPLSRRQGPDTDYARAAFEGHLGVAPGASVSNVYHRDEWGFGGDSIQSIRFDFDDPSIVAEIVARQRLEEVPPEGLPQVRYLHGPSWWPERAALAALPRVYARGRIDFLWVDEENGRAYFQRAQF